MTNESHKELPNFLKSNITGSFAFLSSKASTTASDRKSTGSFAFFLGIQGIYITTKVQYLSMSTIAGHGLEVRLKFVFGIEIVDEFYRFCSGICNQEDVKVFGRYVL